MNTLTKYLLTTCLIAFLCASCSVPEVDEVEIVQEEPVVLTENKFIDATSASATGISLSCLKINYPFQFETVNGSVIPVTNSSEYVLALNDNEDYVIDFVYPLEVFIDNVSAVVQDVQELGASFAECIPEQGWTGDDFPAFLINEETSCYELVYPVELKNAAGEEISVNDEESFIDAIASGYNFFVFPVELLLDGNFFVDAGQSMDLFDILNSCEEGFNPCECYLSGGYIGCYSLVFPVSFVTTSGSSIVTTNLDELNNLILNEDYLEFEYPLTIIYPGDGVNQVINSDNELFDAMDLCITEKGTLYDRLSYSAEICYEVEFPMEAKLPNGTVLSITNYYDLYNYDYEFDDIEVVFPFTLDLYYGSEVKVETEQQFIEILEEC